ncbi:aspartyl-phosphate phosphatase Spo0E family protein [Ureibacillus composti]|nr:aspartyl-phosphate phosphatase Spo0E family protein [Ureibacillus composti]
MKSFLYKKILKMIIEIKRKSMIRKANDLGYTHPDVVTCSQELDTLLNIYSRQAA